MIRDTSPRSSEGEDFGFGSTKFLLKCHSLLSQVQSYPLKTLKLKDGLFPNLHATLPHHIARMTEMIELRPNKT